MNMPADNVRPHILKIARDIASRERGLLTKDEFEDMAINAYECEWLTPYISDKALAARINRVIPHCRPLYNPNCPGTYDEAAIYSLLPELLERYMTLRSRGGDAQDPRDR